MELGNIQRIIDSVSSSNVFEKSLKNKGREEIRINKPEKIIIRERKIEEILTNFIVKKFFRNKETLYNFLSLIFNTFENALEIYCEKKNLNTRDIIFIHKGGNILRFISREFWTELPRDATRKLGDYYAPFFSRSDIDFSIYINPNLDNFDQIYQELCYISFLLLGGLRKIYTKDKEQYFDIYKYNKDYQMKLLEKLKRDLAPITHIALDNVREDGRDFENINRFDRVTPKGSNLTIQYLEIKSPFVNKIREDINIMRGDKNMKFGLARTKVKFALWDNNEVEDFWGELIDITVIHRDYPDVNEFFLNLDKNIMRYNIKYKDKNFSFISYSLSYLIEDLSHMLFVEQTFPWHNIKYKKRMGRLMYLYFVELMIKINERNERLSILSNVRRLKKKSRNVELSIDKLPIYLNDIQKKIQDLQGNKKKIETKEYLNFSNCIDENIQILIDTIDGIRDYCKQSGRVDIENLYNTQTSVLI